MASNPANPTRTKVVELIEWIGDKVSSELDGIHEEYAIDDYSDPEQDFSHLDDEAMQDLDQAMTNFRRISETYDWLFRFLNAEMDETGAFDPVEDPMVRHTLRDVAGKCKVEGPHPRSTCAMFDTSTLSFDAPAGAGDDVEAYRG